MPEHLRLWRSVLHREALAIGNSVTDYGRLVLQHRGKTKGTPEDKRAAELPKPEATSDVALDARALAVRLEHTDWTKKRIAKNLGCNEKGLCPARCPKLAAALKAHRAPDPFRKVPRGWKDRDGNVEAWDE